MQTIKFLKFLKLIKKNVFYKDYFIKYYKISLLFIKNTY